jgi:hypothetical protein
MRSVSRLIIAACFVLIAIYLKDNTDGVDCNFREPPRLSLDGSDIERINPMSLRICSAIACRPQHLPSPVAKPSLRTILIPVASPKC